MANKDVFRGSLSKEMAQAICTSGARSEALRLALALIAHCGKYGNPSIPLDRGECNPGYDKLAEVSGIPKDNIGRARDRLVELGLLEVVKQGKRPVSTTYRWRVWDAHLQSDSQPTPKSQPKPDHRRTRASEDDFTQQPALEQGEPWEDEAEPNAAPEAGLSADLNDGDNPFAKAPEPPPKGDDWDDVLGLPKPKATTDPDPKPKARSSAKPFDVKAAIGRVAKGESAEDIVPEARGNDSEKPKGSTPPQPVLHTPDEPTQGPDPVIKEMLKNAGVQGVRLDQAASNRELTPDIVRKHIEDSASKTSPAAWLAITCINYVPSKTGGGVKYDEHGRIDNWPKPRPDSGEVHIRMFCDQIGIRFDQHDAFQRELRRILEENPGMTGEESRAASDDLIRRIREGEFDNG